MVEADYSEVYALDKEAAASLKRQPREMHRILAKAAAVERRTHEYRNRTRHLEQSTFASRPPSFDGNDVEVEFGARTHYASHVQNMGLMRVRALAREATDEVRLTFLAEATALARL